MQNENELHAFCNGRKIHFPYQARACLRESRQSSSPFPFTQQFPLLGGVPCPHWPTKNIKYAIFEKKHLKVNQSFFFYYYYIEPVIGRGRSSYSRPLRNVLSRMDEVTDGPLSVLRRCMTEKRRIKVSSSSSFFNDESFHAIRSSLCDYYPQRDEGDVWNA